MTTDLLSWAFQALILGAGIYLFLRFLRTTRGSGLMRGLVMTLILGLIALAGLAKLLGLDELEQLITSFTPSIAVILVILFQPELRRIISQLGEQNRLGKLLRKGEDETLSEVVQGISAMAGRRVGALVAFERDFALDEYTHNAVPLDSKVNRLTLESIFHPGGSLHDGAVVIRGDRIVAAACLFPLTENRELSKSTGTRHRAAIGLTEETDAVTVTVSEETGRVAVCRRGKMEKGLSPQQLEKVLREKLGAPDAEGEGGPEQGAFRRFLGGLVWTFTQDVPRKLSAVALGALLVFIAHREIRNEYEFNVRVAATTGSSDSTAGGFFYVRLPSDDYQLIAPAENKWYTLIVRGSPAQVDGLGRSLKGFIDVTDEMAGQPLELRIADLQGNWDDVLGLEVAWKNGAPRIEVQKRERFDVNLGPEHLAFDRGRIDPNHQLDLEHVDFDPDAIVVVGPSELGRALGSADLPLLLEKLPLAQGASTAQTFRLRLHTSLRERGFSIEGDLPVTVTVPITAVSREIGIHEQDITIAGLTSRDDSDKRYELPALSEKARFRIHTTGILPAEVEPGSQDWLERTAAIRKFIQENLRVFVDTSSIEPGSTNEVAIEWMWRRRWGVARDGEPARIDEPGQLEVELSSEPRILLMEVETSESGGGDGSGTSEGN